MEFPEFWRQNPWARDAVVPLVILLLAALTFYDRGGTLVSVVMVAPLFFRRTAPEIVLVIVAAFAVFQLVLLREPIVGDIAVPVAVHAATTHAKHPAWGWSALTLGLFGSLLGPLSWFGIDGTLSGSLSGPVPAYAAVCAASVIVAFLIGRRDVVHAKESTAAVQERQRLLAVQRRQDAEMAAAGERTRIARELHDIVAHSLSVVVVQAEGGRAAAKADPGVAAEVLGTIAGTARTALGDMRRLVGVLRAGGGPESSHPDYAPAPSVQDVPELVEQVRAAGLQVQLQVSGVPRELPAGIGLAVYRLVQESLTNVIKHAGPAATAEVGIHWGPSEIHVSVIDDGRGAAAAATSDHGGNGLTGMRERVALQGGTVAAHPRPGGGFMVTATLPLTAGHPSAAAPDARFRDELAHDATRPLARP